MNKVYKWFWGNILGRKEFYSGYTSKKGVVVTLYIYVSGFLGYNFSLLWVYVRHFTGFDVRVYFGINGKAGSLFLSFSFMLIFFIINYFFLLQNNRYESIIDEFTVMMDKKEISKKSENLRRMMVLTSFVLLTFLNLFIATEVF